MKIDITEDLVKKMREYYDSKKRKLEEIKNINPIDYYLKSIKKNENGVREFLFQSKKYHNDFMKINILEENEMFIIEEILHCDNKYELTRLVSLFDKQEIMKYIWNRFFQEFKNDEVMKPLRTKYIFLKNK